MLEDLVAFDPNNAPMNGMPDMDRSGAGWRNALKPALGGVARNRKWEIVWTKVAKNGLNRMDGELDAGDNLRRKTAVRL